MNVSYKRQPQPVDVAGSKKQNGSLKSIKGNSTGKAEKIMNQLESTEAKATKIINEDLQKMKDLISYNRKTQ
jgi:ribosomal protein S13